MTRRSRARLRRRAGLMVVSVLVTGGVLSFGAVAGAAGDASGGRLTAAPVPVTDAGVTLSGACNGAATVRDGSGQVLDVVTAPSGEGASASHPIVVDPAGSIAYKGSSTPAITNHRWSIKFEGIEVMSGGSANSSGLRQTTGVKLVSDFLPAHLLTGTYYVEGTISGAGGTCLGAAFVKLGGSPFTTVAFYLAALLLLLGIFLLLFARPESGTRMMRRSARTRTLTPPATQP